MRLSLRHCAAGWDPVGGVPCAAGPACVLLRDPSLITLRRRPRPELSGAATPGRGGSNCLGRRAGLNLRPPVTCACVCLALSWSSLRTRSALPLASQPASRLLRPFLRRSSSSRPVVYLWCVSRLGCILLWYLWLLRLGATCVCVCVCVCVSTQRLVLCCLVLS